jgi:hypothetical protein
MAGVTLRNLWNFAEIIINKMQGNSVRMVFNLFAEVIRQPDMSGHPSTFRWHNVLEKPTMKLNLKAYTRFIKLQQCPVFFN